MLLSLRLTSVVWCHTVSCN